jgi:hypothetical protein
MHEDTPIFSSTSIFFSGCGPIQAVYTAFSGPENGSPDPPEAGFRARPEPCLSILAISTRTHLIFLTCNLSFTLGR